MSKESTATDLIIKLPAVMTAEAFTNDDEFEKLYSQVKEAVDKHVPDLSTKTGRDAIASVAYKVSRTKTALIAQGKKLTEGWRDQTKKVNAACNTIEERLDKLRDDTRKPLTDWEDAEMARVNGLKARLEKLVSLSKVGFGRTSADLSELYSEAENTPTGVDHWEEFAPQAAVAREDAMGTLKRLFATAKKQEDDALELERLRAEAAERDRVEAERLAAAEAERVEAARIERERQAEEARKAELAKVAEEATARVERENAERVAAAERQAKEAQERAAWEIAEAVAKAERDAAAQEAWRVQKEQEIAERAAAERQRVAAAQEAEAAEQRRRYADREHRKSVNNAIIAEFVECAGITAEQGQKIVVHLVGGLVPNVTLKY